MGDRFCLFDPGQDIEARDPVVLGVDGLLYKAPANGMIIKTALDTGKYYWAPADDCIALESGWCVKTRSRASRPIVVRMRAHQ